MQIESSNSFHKIHGLTIKSFIPLSNAPQQPGTCDVAVKLGNVKSAKVVDGFDKNCVFVSGTGIVAATDQAFYVEWFGTGSFLVQNGSIITVEPAPGRSEKAMIPFLNGPILAIVLHQRRNLVLHASAVQIGKGACLFLGNKGYGKSTFAAHLNARGHRIVSDDVVPVSFHANIPSTEPGNPQIRLRSDTAASIGLNLLDLTPLEGTLPIKYEIKCDNNFSVGPIPVSNIYILERSEKISIERTTFAQSFIELVRNSYISRYVNPTGQTTAYFKHCENLASRIPVFHLKRPHDFSCLSHVTDLLEYQVQNQSTLDK